MGYDVRFNWILQLTPKQGFPEELKKNKTYSFEKEMERIYPIETPIELMDEKRQIVGKIIIKKITITKNKTQGEFEIVEIK